MLKIKQKILPDISNVAGFYDCFPPKMENIDCMYYSLRDEFWIIGIADWGLYNCIDDVQRLQWYLARRVITFSPPGTKADIPLLETAIKLDCCIISNDRFLDHMDIIPSESWLESHRIPFKIYKGEFIIYFPK